jgi:nitroimidazol reductase NimA-like FMN-containing flavoprotein (pyridoxamine 5'-phosphate oxidase superfamily)
MQVRDVDLAAARRMFGGLPVVSVATIDRDGSPHVVPLWFVWPEDAIYVSTRREGRTWANAVADPRVALTVDLGRSWVEIAGVEVRGLARPLPAEHADLRRAISAWHEKYRPLFSGDGFPRFSEEVRDLGFLRVVPERIAAWDHARG